MAAKDIIAIEGLKVDCIVGVYPDERDRLQPLNVDLRMFLDTRRAGDEQRLAHTVDYAAVASQIAFLLQSCRFYMLETAARVLTRHLLAPPGPDEKRARVDEVELRLTKPYALAGRGVPSLEVHRSAADVSLAQETSDFGTIDIIDETKQLGVYRLNIAPGETIPLHVHHRMDEAEMTLTEGLHVQRTERRAGTVHRWPRGAAHVYDNPMSKWASVLCVDTPPFIRDDEVRVDGEPAQVRPEPPFIAGAP